MNSTYSVYLFLHLIVKTVSAKECNHKASWYICFPFLLFYLIGPIILLSTLFSKTLLRNKVSTLTKPQRRLWLYTFLSLVYSEWYETISPFYMHWMHRYTDPTICGNVKWKMEVQRLDIILKLIKSPTWHSNNNVQEICLVIWYLKFSQQCILKLQASGKWCRVVWEIDTSISEKLCCSIFTE